jgi:A/G-specific adenine glycosylase
MLQQTRVDTVIPHYDRFLSRFSTVEALAKAPLQSVLKSWENMGYYGRARNLHHAAGMVVTRMGGRIPESREELLRLPGIGAYTASAILSFAFGQSVLAMDANVKRVLCRLFAVEQPLEEKRAMERIEGLGKTLLPRKDSSAFNQAMMDLGAMICMPRKPGCRDCPLQDYCLAFQRNIQDTLPIKRKRAPLRHREMTAALICDQRGRFLVAQRPADGLLGGLWKFPGGERKGGETLSEAVERTVYAEATVQARAVAEIGIIRHTFTHFHMSLHVFECLMTEGPPHAAGCARLRWAKPHALRSLPFGKADRKILEIIMAKRVTSVASQ